jgi:hypothetical protein
VVIDQCQIRNSQTEFARTPPPSAILPRLVTTILSLEWRHAGVHAMFWILLGLMGGMAAMAILSVDQLDGKIPSRKQEAVSWD